VPPRGGCKTSPVRGVAYENLRVSAAVWIKTGGREPWGRGREKKSWPSMQSQGGPVAATRVCRVFVFFFIFFVPFALGRAENAYF